MALFDQFEQQGNWLFRWRSYLPFLLIALIAVALWHFHWPFNSYHFHEFWEDVCLWISLAGLLIRVATVGCTPANTSGRNTSHQIADSLNTTGMYSVVRHPLYLGNYLIGFGISFVLFVWWLPVIYTLLFWLYYERIMYAEENFLRREFGREFDDWARRTPTVWPKRSLWKPPALPFSMRNVLRREYSALFVIVLGHTGVEFFEHIIVDHHMVWERFWIAFSVGGAITYVVLRTLKKTTALLDVPGR